VSLAFGPIPMLLAVDVDHRCTKRRSLIERLPEDVWTTGVGAAISSHETGVSWQDKSVPGEESLEAGLLCESDETVDEAMDEGGLD
jgi:hypothetical protein